MGTPSRGTQGAQSASIASSVGPQVRDMALLDYHPEPLGIFGRTIKATDPTTTPNPIEL